MRYGSLFTGIGGFDLGFERAGMECAWQVEIDKDCQRVLKRHWPNVQRFDDVTTVREFEPVDLICGGFPCQDLSVAGKRAGLAGERSGLWFEFLRIIESNLPRWIVIENVPGLLSSEGGTDFRILLNGLVNVGYCLAWRVLDAQYFGVAQRRRRVFIVGSLGNGSCAEVLFESESVPGNPPARGEAGQRVARVAETSPTLGSSNFKPTKSTSGSQIDFCVPDVAWALQERDAKDSDSDTKDGHLIVQPGYIHPRQMRGSESSNQVGIKPDAHVTDALLQEGPGAVLVPLVTHALRSEGADASEDGTGRGTPLVACLTPWDAQTKRIHSENGIAPSLASSNGQGGQRVPYIAFSSKDHGADAGDIAPTLRAQNFKDSHLNGGGQVAIAFAQNSRDEVRVQGDGNISGALASEPGMKQTTYLAFHENKSGQLTEAHVLGLRSGASHSYQGVGGSFGVRRLTPRECERLQGFPDDWTRYDSEGKEISDSARYRMLGNAVEVDCAEWIGKRISRYFQN